MNKFGKFLVRFAVPLCALGAIIVRIVYTVRNQIELASQYDIYLFLVILIVSTVYAIRKKGNERV